jgi:hypothetical protein
MNQKYFLPEGMKILCKECDHRVLTTNLDIYKANSSLPTLSGPGSLMASRIFTIANGRHDINDGVRGLGAHRQLARPVGATGRGAPDSRDSDRRAAPPAGLRVSTGNRGINFVTTSDLSAQVATTCQYKHHES